MEHVNPELAKLLGYVNLDKLFVRAKDCSVWDSEGNEYLDFLGGYGALNFGHNRTEIFDALNSVRESPSLLQITLNPLAGALAKNLAELAPGDLKYCFFENSGAEAVESALKLALAAAGRGKLVSCYGAYHGITMGALSVSSREKYFPPFSHAIPGVGFIPFGDAQALKLALSPKDVAAFIVEPIQGEGGINVPYDGYLTEVRKICTETGTVLIIDEIQTGLGRTGNLFACEHENVAPDILCLGKSLAGGILPLSVSMVTDEVWKKASEKLGSAAVDQSTFGGNGKALAAGLAALEILLNEDLSKQAEEKGSYLLEKLLLLKEKYPIIKEVRGRGLMLGMEFRQPEGHIINRLTHDKLEELSYEYIGVLAAGELLNKHNIITAYTLNNPRVIRFEPPLTVSYEQLDRLVEALEEVCRRNSGFYHLAASGAMTMIKSRSKK